MPGPTPHTLDMKTITQTEFCKAALQMPDRASADQLVTEYAKHRELDVNYVRWFIVSWTEKNDHYQVELARKLYGPEPLENVKRKT